jgi:hypothetical protein
MTLMQRGGEVTGTVFVEDKEWQIAEGRTADSGLLGIRIEVPNDVVHFELRVAGDHITGKATGEKDPKDPAVEVDLTRNVPARPAFDISGTWSGTMAGKGESIPLTIEFHQKGGEVSGVAKAKDKDAPLKGEMNGAKLTFVVESGSEKVRFALIATPKTISGFAAVQGHTNAVVLDVELTPKP